MSERLILNSTGLKLYYDGEVVAEIKSNEDKPMKYIVTTDLLEDMGMGDEISKSWRDRMIQEGCPESWFEAVEHVAEGQYWEVCEDNIIRVRSVKNDRVRLSRIDTDQRTDYRWPKDYLLYYRKLSTEEIEQALKEQVKERYELGTKVGYLDGRNNEVEGYKEWNYCPQTDALYGTTTASGERDAIYQKGNWAEIVDQTPDIEINGYQAEFHDDCVQFGCAKIETSFFIDLAKCIKQEALDSQSDIGNRVIEGVKIGKGLFTLDQIKQIANYYE